MARVLVIDDDAGTLVGYKHILRLAGHEVATTALGEDGIALALRDPFDVVLCDQRLPDVPGITVVHTISESCPRTRIVLVTAWGTPELAIEAKRNGATIFAEKPLIGDELVRVVDEAARRGASGNEVHDRESIGYAARRWADLVARGVYLSDDPKTVSAWSHGIGVALGTLKKHCAAADVLTKASLDLVRMLRVVIRNPGGRWELQRRVDILDERTAHALLERAGFGAPTSQIPSLEIFLSNQRLIARSELIAALRERLLQWA